MTDNLNTGAGDRPFSDSFVYHNTTMLDSRAVSAMACAFAQSERMYRERKISLSTIGSVFTVLGFMWLFDQSGVTVPLKIVCAALLIVMGVFSVVFSLVGYEKKIEREFLREHGCDNAARVYTANNDGIERLLNGESNLFSWAEFTEVKRYRGYIFLTNEDAYLVFDQNGFTEGTADGFVRDARHMLGRAGDVDKDDNKEEG